ncbi:hypothetical protein V1509DRAFT_622882 [Lipomyces kononenkoae]
MSDRKRVPYGGAIGMRSSSSMDFHRHNNTAAAAAAAAAGLPRSSSGASLSSAAAATALKRANSLDSAHGGMMPSKRAEQRASAGRLERKSSMTERDLRSQSVGPDHRLLRQKNKRESAPLAGLQKNLITSTASLPRTLRSPGWRKSSSGYASSIRSYESDLNSISEDRTLDTSSILSSPKLVASKKVPPGIAEESLSPPVKHEPHSRSLSPSKSALKDTSRPSSVTSSQYDAEETNHSSAKKHVRISFSSTTSSPPPVLPAFTPQRGTIKLDRDLCDNDAGESALEDLDAASAHDGVNDASPTVKPQPDGITASLRQRPNLEHSVQDNEEEGSDSEGSVYEDALDTFFALDRDEFPNLFAVLDESTRQTNQVNGIVAEGKQIGENAVNRLPEAAKLRPTAETNTKQQAGGVVRKAVGSSGSSGIKPHVSPTDAEFESREKSRDPTLQHPTPRSAKPLNGILKTPSPELTRTAGSYHQKSGRVPQRSLPGKSSNSPPPLPSFSSPIGSNATQKNGNSLSSVRRNPVVGSPTMNGIKPPLRDTMPAQELSTLPQLEGTPSMPASQAANNYRVLHRNKASQLPATRPSTQPASAPGSLPLGPLQRSNSASSFQREGGYESDSKPFGFKKILSAAVPSRRHSQGLIGSKGRNGILDSNLEDESPAFHPHSDSTTRNLAVAMSTPTTDTFGGIVNSRIADSDSDDEQIDAPPSHTRKSFHSSQRFAYERKAGIDTNRNIYEEPDYSYDDATAGVAISDGVMPRPPPVMEESAFSEPATPPPVRHRKLSQYQQHRLEKQQQKEEKGRLKNVPEPPRNYGPTNVTTNIGPIANINSVQMPQPRKKKFGGLRKIFGLDH